MIECGFFFAPLPASASRRARQKRDWDNGPARNGRCECCQYRDRLCCGKLPCHCRFIAEGSPDRLSIFVCARWQCHVFVGAIAPHGPAGGRVQSDHLWLNVTPSLRSRVRILMNLRFFANSVNIHAAKYFAPHYNGLVSSILRDRIMPAPWLCGLFFAWTSGIAGDAFALPRQAGAAKPGGRPTRPGLRGATEIHHPVGFPG